LSDFLSGAGLVIAAACAAASILLPAGRPRSAAMLAAVCSRMPAASSRK